MPDIWAAELRNRRVVAAYIWALVPTGHNIANWLNILQYLIFLDI